MKPGLIQSSRAIFWGAEKHKVSFMPYGDDEFMLSDSIWKGATIQSFHCSDCSKILIDLSGS